MNLMGEYKKWVKPSSQKTNGYHYLITEHLSLCGQILDGVDSVLVECENVEEEYICRRCKRKLDEILSDFVDTGWTA